MTEEGLEPVQDDEFVIGLVRAAFGLDGYASVTSCSGEYDHFFPLKDVILRKNGKRRRAVIESLDIGEKGLLILFAGCEGADDALKLVDSEIIVPRSKGAPLRRGEYYDRDLVGCFLTLGGQPAAEILSVIEGGAYDFLEAKRPDGANQLVPFNKEFIGEVDISGRRVELLKGWILE